MCALRAHIKQFIFGNIFLKIEKAVNIFSIFEKIFPKMDGLMCALKTYIDKIISKMIYYCVLLWCTLIKSIQITITTLILCLFILLFNNSTCKSSVVVRISHGPLSLSSTHPLWLLCHSICLLSFCQTPLFV